MASSVTKENLLKELNDIKLKAELAARQLETAQINHYRHQGAVKAVLCLLEEYFPEDKSNEPPSVGEKPTVA